MITNRSTMKYLSLILLLIVSFYTKAQTGTLLITKEEVISKVKEGNNTLKISLQEVLSASGDFNQTNAVFLPNITASHTGIATTNPLMAFGSKLNQGILTQNDFNPNLLNDPSQIENYATKIEIIQPILNLDGLHQRKAAKAKLSAIRLQSHRTEEYITLEVEKWYMQLQLAYKTLEVLETTKRSVLENKRIANNSFTQGYLQKTDLLSIDVRVTEIENQLQNAKSNIQNTSNYLSILMGDTSYQVLKPIDELNVISEEKPIGNLSKNRADIKAFQFSTDAYEQMNKADKMSFLPRLNAFGSYELFDDNVFQADANGYTFGAQLSWNILEGSKRFGKAQKSRAEFEKSKLQYQEYVAQSQLELNKASRMLLDAKNNLKLTELALQQSKEALRIRTNRFKEGLEKTSDLLMAENQYAQKQLEYYQTMYTYNFGYVYLQFLTKEHLEK